MKLLESPNSKITKNEKASLSGCSMTLEQKRSFRPQFQPQIFLEVSALVAVRHCPKLQSCTIISRKYNDATLKKWHKP